MKNFANFIKDNTSLFSADVIEKAEQFYALQNPQQLKQLNLQIRKNMYQMEHSSDAQQKYVLKQQCEGMIRKRDELVSQRQQNSFSDLDYNVRCYLCMVALVNKYLLEEAKIHSIKSNMTFATQEFQNSQAYQELVHIRDYVNDYIARNSKKVVNHRYFVKLHKDCKDFGELRKVADAYFEELNSSERKKGDKIQNSHSGKVIATFPELGVQVVQLFEKRALNYEGATMHHCVGSYADRVAKNETAIFSLRDVASPDQECVPHATMEFSDGKIKQIKGPYDGMIEPHYMLAARRMACVLLNVDSLRDTQIAEAEKNNLGFILDDGENECDLLGIERTNIKSLALRAEYCEQINFDNINVNELHLNGEISENTLRALSKIKNIREVYFKIGENFKTNKIDFSNVPLNKIFMSGKSLTMHEFVLPEELDILEIQGDFPSLAEMKLPDGLKKLEINGSFPLQVLDLPEGLDTLEIQGDFSSLAEMKLPDGLKKLEINGSFPLQVLDLPEGLEALEIRGDFSSLAEVKLPVGLKKLKINGSFPLQVLDLPDGLDTLEIRGDFPSLSKLVLPKDIRTLELSKNFPALSELQLSENLETLHIEGNFSLNELYLPDSLKALEMSGDFPYLRKLVLSDKLEKFVMSGEFPLLQGVELPKSIERVRTSFVFSGRFPHLRELECGGLSEGFDFENIEEIKLSGKVKTPRVLDLSGCKKLFALDFGGSATLDTEKIILPSSLQVMIGDACSFYKLKEVDLRAVDCTCFGKITGNKFSLVFGNSDDFMTKVANPTVASGYPFLGISLGQVANAPNLKRILFPQKIEEIYLRYMNVNGFDVDFAQYPNLRVLEIDEKCKCTKACINSISRCRNLERLVINGQEIALPIQASKKRLNFLSGLKKKIR